MDVAYMHWVSFYSENSELNFMIQLKAKIVTMFFLPR